MRFLVLLLAVAAALPVQAQGRNNYGSIYSRYGVGQRIDFATSQGAGLGGTGVAIRSGAYTSLTNPALWSDQRLTTFSAAASVAGVWATDALSDETAEATAGDLEGLHFGVPLIPARLGLVASFRPYSRVNYRAAVPGQLVTEQDTASYQINQEGTGGLQQISTGLGLRLGEAVQLGASADVVFGTFEYLQRTTFDGAEYVETRQADATQLRGLTGTFGGAVSARKIAGENDVLTLGASLTLPTTLGGTRTRTLGESLDRDTVATEIDADLSLPLVARAGLSYRSGSRVLATVEGQYEPWSSFDSTVPVGGFQPSGASELQDRVRVGGGVEFVPAGVNNRAGLFRRAAYRIGGFSERGLYAPAGEDVGTLGVTAGVSFPTRLSGARLDLGLEAGTRGSETGVLVRDRYLKGTVTLNFGERWFVRRRLD